MLILFFLLTRIQLLEGDHDYNYVLVQVYYKKLIKKLEHLNILKI